MFPGVCDQDMFKAELHLQPGTHTSAFLMTEKTKDKHAEQVHQQRDCRSHTGICCAARGCMESAGVLLLCCPAAGKAAASAKPTCLGELSPLPRGELPCNNKLRPFRPNKAGCKLAV